MRDVPRRPKEEGTGVHSANPVLTQALEQQEQQQRLPDELVY
jgi:hypothetical protein